MKLLWFCQRLCALCVLLFCSAAHAYDPPPFFDVYIDLRPLNGTPFTLEFDYVSGGTIGDYGTGDVSYVLFYNFETDSTFTVPFPTTISRGYIDLYFDSATFVHFGFRGWSFLNGGIEPNVASDRLSAFLLTADGTASLITTADPTGSDSLFGYDMGYVDGGGRVMGIFAGTSDGTAVYILAQSVPEPVSIWLYAAGLLGLLIGVRLQGTPRHRARELGAGIGLMLVAANAAALEDVTSSVAMSRSGYTYNRTTQTFDSTITITPERRFDMLNELVVIIEDIAFTSPPKGFLNLVITNATTAVNNQPAIQIALPGNALRGGQPIRINLKVKYLLEDGSSPRVMTPGISFRIRVLSNPEGNQYFYPIPNVPSNPYAGFPLNPITGNPVIFSSPAGDMSIEYNPSLRRPLTAVARCTAVITSCIAPGLRSVDQCVRYAPRCQTATPWLEDAVCCPNACIDQYRFARQDSASESDAFFGVFFRDGQCFPGFSGMPNIRISREHGK